MLKFTDKDREQLAEMKQAWASFAVFATLVICPTLIRNLLNEKWNLVVVAAIIPAWFLLMPWRWGNLSDKTRREMRSWFGLMICYPLFLKLTDYLP